ncbi:MAG: substrate-binding domain-containing protein [Clostridia bacterium]|nr:substrate-binding domain-containing protein [Clostridia bacterium]
MSKTIRMADIAEKLGISVVSVSKGLSGREGVSEELRARIWATARELGYQNTREAASAAPQSGSIGILVPDRFFNDDAFYNSLYRDLLTSCQRRKLVALMEIVSNEAEWACAAPTLVEARRVDGLIFMGEFTSDYIRAATATGVPYVLLDFFKDDISADSIVSDNVHGGYALTERLLDAGHTRVGFVGSTWATNSIMDRYLGYCKALYRRGIEPRPDWRVEDRDRAGAFIPIELPEDMPDAFVCNCDVVAYNLVELLKSKGYRVPEDVAVTGYDDFRYALLSRPTLTTYAVNVPAMAEAATAILSRRIQKRSVDAPMRVIPGHLIVRESG